MRAVLVASILAIALASLLVACNDDTSPAPSPQNGSVDPSPTLSPSRPPPSPENGLGLLEFETVDIGDQSGIMSETSEVFKLDTQAELEEFWSRHTANVSPMPELPTVDFSQEMVIAAFDHAEATGGYRFEITRINKAGSKLVLRADKGIPDRECGVAAVITQPFHIVRMAILDLEPALAVVEKTYTCP